MASQLAQTAKVFRLMFFAFIAFFIIYIIFSELIGFLFKLQAARKPKKVEVATVGFGKLPKLAIKGMALSGDAPTYELETTTGTLPQMPARIKVYKFVEPTASFLSLEKAKSLARKLNFITIAKEVSPSLYFWQEADGRTLRANTVTSNFQADLDLNQLTFSVGDLPAPGEIKTTAKGYVGGRGLLKSGFEIGTQEVVLLKKSGQDLTKAVSLSEASLAKADFYRGIKDSDDQTITALPQNPKLGLITMIYVGNTAVTFPKVKYTVWDYDFTKPETYPLHSINTAWSEVKNNNGFITYLQYQGSDSINILNTASLQKVIIRKVYLSYFDDESIQGYLQPIYVFEGDGKDLDGKAVDIIIYYPAIDPAWVEQPQPEGE